MAAEVVQPNPHTRGGFRITPSVISNALTLAELPASDIAVIDSEVIVADRAPLLAVVHFDPTSDDRPRGDRVAHAQVAVHRRRCEEPSASLPLLGWVADTSIVTIMADVRRRT